VAAGLLLAACAAPTPEVKEIEVTREVTREVPVEVTRVVEVTPEGGIPFEALWAGSAHADKSAEAFRHWDEDSPPQVPDTCAKCHSTPGFLDFIGEDGSEAGKVDQPAPVGTVIDCAACHNTTTVAMTSAAFPSSAVISGLGPEARCMQCHQGLAWGGSVDEAIVKAGLTDDDTIGPDLGFTNIHYFAAAVARYGTQVKGGYEYPGQDYDVLFDHVRGIEGCTDCHDPHSLQIKIDTCKGCHTEVATPDDLKNVRMASSTKDYDGDGDLEEGIYFEIDGLRSLLLQAMQAYASEVSQTPIVYDPITYPYFFIDTNANSAADADEVSFDNKYNAWTGRLAKAAYNYQTSLKDPGAFAHGGKYIIQLLYDSVESLNEKISAQVDLSNAHRSDSGHFAGSEKAFRHWDANGAVPGGCARCHSGEGLKTFLAEGTNVSVAPSNGFLCSNCHDSLTEFTRYPVNSVKFPGGATLTFGEGEEANLCMLCHQGRESAKSVDAAIGGLADDELKLKDDGTSVLSFRNIHYFAAGATLFGAEAGGAYEYDGEEYLGRNLHGGTEAAPDFGGPTKCTECHSTHGLSVKVDSCVTCHKTVQAEADVLNIRWPSDTTDWDGDGDAAEGIRGEIITMSDALYAALRAYARDGAPKTGIVYDPATHPYFFLDADGDGQADKDDQGASKRYNLWTPRLLRAAYNYQYSQKDPGAFAHNGKYVLQILYDSLQDIGGASAVKGMTRP
jgi:hypothetical protein